MNTTPWISKDGVSDADLVRAGRDLLAALEMVLNHPLSSLSPVTEGAARAAIAKARGGRS